MLTTAVEINAQNPTSLELLTPPSDSWPGYHGDYSGRRHSRLTQITPANVEKLGLAWAFQTSQGAEIKSTPLVVDGIAYLTVPDNIWAIDARSGHLIWHYRYPPNNGLQIGHRGLGMYKGWLFFLTPDAHLVSLNAKDGSVRWTVRVADSSKGYWTTMAPLIVKDNVIVGVSGDFDNLSGFLRSVDPETGQTRWQWDSSPPVGTPNMTTGAMTWMTGTYDPDLDLIYWGTGNPTPVLNGKPRPGDNLYTCSIVAIHPDTGKLAWAFQASPHDTHDWDAAETPVLVDGDFQGQAAQDVNADLPQRLLFRPRPDQRTKSSERSLRANELVPGRRQARPADPKSREGACSRRTLHRARRRWHDQLPIAQLRSHHRVVYRGRPSQLQPLLREARRWRLRVGRRRLRLMGERSDRSHRLPTGKIRWSHELGHGGSGAGVLTTDSGVVFTGDAAGNVLALDSSTGKTLWHAGAGGPMDSSPITYELDGHQYVMTSSGGVLFAWKLPDAAVADH